MFTDSNLHLVLQAAHQAPSADNSQPWRLDWHDQTLSVSYDTARVGHKTFPADSPATLLTMGAVLENINQAANAAGWLLTWQIPSALDPDQPVYFQALAGQANEKTEASTDMLPLFKRHTNRLPYRSQALPEALLNVLKNLTVASARVVVIDQPSTIRQVARLVRLMSEIRFRTREVHEWLAKSLRFDGPSAAAGDGLDVDTLDLPPGGTAVLRLMSAWRRMEILNWFGAYKILSFIDSRPIRYAPALIAIVSPSGFQDLLAAGQLMERIWITLNAQGVAVQPDYVLADQLHRRQAGVIPPGLEKQADAAFDEARHLFQFGQGETLQMLLRIGYPKKAPVLSKRLPLEAVCSEIKRDANY